MFNLKKNPTLLIILIAVLLFAVIVGSYNSFFGHREGLSIDSATYNKLQNLEKEYTALAFLFPQQEAPFFNNNNVAVTECLPWLIPATDSGSRRPPILFDGGHHSGLIPATLVGIQYKWPPCSILNQT